MTIKGTDPYTFNVSECVQIVYNLVIRALVAVTL
jgi:hypothetical protein